MSKATGILLGIGSALRNKAGPILAREFSRRSRALVRFFEVRMETLIPCWIALMLLATALKVVTAPSGTGTLFVGLTMSLPFLALAASPVLGYRIAAGAFPRGRIGEQPMVRLARWGRWRQAPGGEIRRAAITGPAGFLVSLIAGILLNVPVRSLEFLAVVPAINPADPYWAQVLLVTMTFDVVLMNFLYMVCFVMALRGAPLFPRLLVLAWVLDVVLQMTIAKVIGATDFPTMLAQPLVGFLDGNVKKVMISVALWLPYLLLSDQVNLLFRHRVRAAA
jgi:hypothetical protein